MPKPPSRTPVAAVVLVDDLDRPTRLLAARRSEPPALAGRWEFPGGKVEPGERPEDAAVREALEELGVRVRLGSLVEGPLDGGPGRAGAWPLGESYAMLLWWAVARPGEPEPSPLEDHDELRWLVVDTLKEVSWLPADLPIVERVADLLHTTRAEEDRGTPKT